MNGTTQFCPECERLNRHLFEARKQAEGWRTALSLVENERDGLRTELERAGAAAVAKVLTNLRARMLKTVDYDECLSTSDWIQEIDRLAAPAAEPCAVCGKPVPGYPWMADSKGAHKFCSFACADAPRSSDGTPKPAPEPLGKFPRGNFSAIDPDAATAIEELWEHVRAMRKS